MRIQATKFTALLVASSLILPSPALALRTEEAAETDVVDALKLLFVDPIIQVARNAGLTLPPSTIPASPASQPTAVPALAAAGLEEESSDPLWQRAHSKIQDALRSHPGGRLKVRSLAELAGVSVRTLFRHNYRDLVAAENERRAGMQPPGRAIEVQERTEDPESAIVSVLRSHAGGRLTTEELAELAGVGVVTLRNHNYRILVAAENKRRAGMQRPRRTIELQGEDTAIVSALQSHPGGRLTIEELAKLAGVSVTTLRTYNYRGLVAAENERRAGMEPALPGIQLLKRGRPPTAGLEEGKISSNPLLIGDELLEIRVLDQATLLAHSDEFWELVNSIPNDYPGNRAIFDRWANSPKGFASELGFAVWDKASKPVAIGTVFPSSDSRYLPGEAGILASFAVAPRLHGTATASWFLHKILSDVRGSREYSTMHLIAMESGEPVNQKPGSDRSVWFYRASGAREIRKIEPGDTVESFGAEPFKNPHIEFEYHLPADLASIKQHFHRKFQAGLEEVRKWTNELRNFQHFGFANVDDRRGAIKVLDPLMHFLKEAEARRSDFPPDDQLIELGKPILWLIERASKGAVQESDPRRETELTSEALDNILELIEGKTSFDEGPKHTTPDWNRILLYAYSIHHLILSTASETARRTLLVHFYDQLERIAERTTRGIEGSSYVTHLEENGVIVVPRHALSFDVIKSLVMHVGERTMELGIDPYQVKDRKLIWIGIGVIPEFGVRAATGVFPDGRLANGHSHYSRSLLGTAKEERRIRLSPADRDVARKHAHKPSPIPSFVVQWMPSSDQLHTSVLSAGKERWRHYSGDKESKRALEQLGIVSSAGLEEGYFRRVQTKTVAQLESAINPFAPKVARTFHVGPDSFAHARPQSALVRGPGQTDWLYHLHFFYLESDGSGVLGSTNQGLLVPLKVDLELDGEQVTKVHLRGVSREELWAEPRPEDEDESEVIGYAPLGRNLSGAKLEWLQTESEIEVMKIRDLLEQSIRNKLRNPNRYKKSHVLARAIRPSGAQGLFDMFQQIDFDSRGHILIADNMLFQRLDPPKAWWQPSASPAAGLEEVGKVLGTLEGSDITSIALSPTGRLVAAANADGIKMWDVESGSLVRDYQSERPISHLAFSPDGKVLVLSRNPPSWDQSAVIEIRNVDAWEVVETLYGLYRTAFLSFSPNGRLLAAGDQSSGEVTLWPLTKDYHLAEDPAHQILRPGLRRVDASIPLRASFNPSGTLITLAGSKGTISLWDVSSGERLHIRRASRKSIQASLFESSGETLVVVAEAGQISRMRIHDKELVQEFPPLAFGRRSTQIRRARVSAVSLLSGRHLLAYAINHEFLPGWSSRVSSTQRLPPPNDLIFLDTETGESFSFSDFPEEIELTGLAFDPDGKFLVSSDTGRAIRLWPVPEFPKAASSTAGLEERPSGRALGRWIRGERGLRQKGIPFRLIRILQRHGLGSISAARRKSPEELAQLNGITFADIERLYRATRDSIRGHYMKPFPPSPERYPNSIVSLGLKPIHITHLRDAGIFTMPRLIHTPRERLVEHKIGHGTLLPLLRRMFSDRVIAEIDRSLQQRGEHLRMRAELLEMPKPDPPSIEDLRPVAAAGLEEGLKHLLILAPEDDIPGSETVLRYVDQGIRSWRAERFRAGEIEFNAPGIIKTLTGGVREATGEILLAQEVGKGGNALLVMSSDQEVIASLPIAPIPTALLYPRALEDSLQSTIQALHGFGNLAFSRPIDLESSVEVAPAIQEALRALDQKFRTADLEEGWPVAGPVHLQQFTQRFFMEKKDEIMRFLVPNPQERASKLLYVQDASNRDPHMSFAALQEEEIVGIVMGLKFLHLEQSAVHLHNLYVDPSVRGRDIGRWLIEAVETSARSQKIHYILVRVKEDNQDTQWFYEHLGYGISEQPSPFDGKGVTYVKDLRQSQAGLEEGAARLEGEWGASRITGETPVKELVQGARIRITRPSDRLADSEWWIITEPTSTGLAIEVHKLNYLGRAEWFTPKVVSVEELSRMGAWFYRPLTILDRLTLMFRGWALQMLRVVRDDDPVGVEIFELSGNLWEVDELRKLMSRAHVEGGEILVVPTTPLQGTSSEPSVVQGIYVHPSVDEAWGVEALKGRFTGHGRYPLVNEIDQANAVVIGPEADKVVLLAQGKILFEVQDANDAEVLTPDFIRRLELQGGLILPGLGTLIVIQSLFHQDLKEVVLIFA